MTCSRSEAVFRRSSYASPDLGDPPAQSDEQKSPVVHKFGRLPFDGMADKLENPPGDKQGHRNSPESVQEQCDHEQRQRQRDERDAQRVTPAVQRMFMAAATSTEDGS